MRHVQGTSAFVVGVGVIHACYSTLCTNSQPAQARSEINTPRHCSPLQRGKHAHRRAHKWPSGKHGTEKLPYAQEKACQAATPAARGCVLMTSKYGGAWHLAPGESARNGEALSPGEQLQSPRKRRAPAAGSSTPQRKTLQCERTCRPADCQLLG